MYKSQTDFEKDMRQIFKNCFVFNGPEAGVWSQAKLLERSLNEILGVDLEISSMPEEKRLLAEAHQSGHLMSTYIPPQDIPGGIDVTSKCLRILRKLQHRKNGSLFWQPVVLAIFPDYIEKIMPNQPIDLSTIENKLNEGEYLSKAEGDENMMKQYFYDDILLMFDNCSKFNARGSWVAQEGLSFKSYFNREWKREMTNIDSLSPIPTLNSKSISSFAASFECNEGFIENYKTFLAEIGQKSWSSPLWKVEQIGGKILTLCDFQKQADTQEYRNFEHLKRDIYCIVDHCQKISNSENELFRASIELLNFFNLFWKSNSFQEEKNTFNEMNKNTFEIKKYIQDHYIPYFGIDVVSLTDSKERKNVDKLIQTLKELFRHTKIHIENNGLDQLNILQDKVNKNFFQNRTQVESALKEIWTNLKAKISSNLKRC